MIGCKGLRSLLEPPAEQQELENFYPIRADCKDKVPDTHFKLRAGRTLNEKRWLAAFSEDGHLDIAKVLIRIQRGGIHPAIKGPVWEFLLGCFDPNSTSTERELIREQRRVQYNKWKMECINVMPDIGSGDISTTAIASDGGDPAVNSCAEGGVDTTVMDMKIEGWKLALSHIGMDVIRADRTLVFYENVANQSKLRDVLAVYCWMDSDIGYVQGMTDICSPMVVLFENEADAFWCFQHAMKRLRENFRSNSQFMGVQTQLKVLSQVIKIIDPKLHKHLENFTSGEYLFAVRMLMVLFRRECSFLDALFLWEMMWAMEYNPNIFHMYEYDDDPSSSACKSNASNLSDKFLKKCGKFERTFAKSGCSDQQISLYVFLAAGIIKMNNKKILKSQGLDDVLLILDGISGHLDAKKACSLALKIHKKYLNNVQKEQ